MSVLLAQAALVVGSLWVPGLGGPLWHHHATLLLSVLFVAATWRWFTGSRAFLGLGVGVTTLLAVASGFVILYAKPGLKAESLVDWAKFWHVLWSWLSIAFALGHVWINRVPLVRYWHRMHRQVGASIAHYGILVLAAALLALTWSPSGRAWFTEAGYPPLTAYTWLVVVTPAYLGWIALVLARVRSAATRFSTYWSSARIQAVADVGLVPAFVLANVTGFPILYFKPWVHGSGLKYVAKYWHTWPSIFMALFVFIHTVQSWPAIAAHWRHFGTAVGDPGPVRALRRNVAGGVTASASPRRARP